MNIGEKHLAPYFPYRPTVICGDEEFVLNGSYMEAILHVGIPPGHKNYYLVVRPLSQLTEEIEHNGETFVPMDKLFRINTQEDDWGDNVIVERDKYTDTRVNARDAYNSMILQFCEHNISFIQYDDGEGWCEPYMGFELIQKLFEWHFDVFGLIEHGSGIEKPPK